MLAPLLFSLAPQCPYFFHSRIATVTPVSHPLTRLIHISPSCWTIYRSFEIIREMGTVHWIEFQIQCFIQMHCFKKHSVRYELCLTKYFSNGCFLMVWHELFLHTSIWVSEEGQNLKISAKDAVFLISSGKKQISLLLA